jgi:hypothetical protein
MGDRYDASADPAGVAERLGRELRRCEGGLDPLPDELLVAYLIPGFWETARRDGLAIDRAAFERAFLAGYHEDA